MVLKPVVLGVHHLKKPLYRCMDDFHNLDVHLPGFGDYRCLHGPIFQQRRVHQLSAVALGAVLILLGPTISGWFGRFVNSLMWKSYGVSRWNDLPSVGFPDYMEESWNILNVSKIIQVIRELKQTWWLGGPLFFEARELIRPGTRHRRRTGRCCTSCTMVINGEFLRRWWGMVHIISLLQSVDIYI